MREAIARAGSVLIVGAGPTGLEAAGYIKDKYRDEGKRVGVCQRGRSLLPELDGAHDIAMDACK